MASSYITFYIKVDPGAQVLQALVSVPTTVCTSVSRVCPLNIYGVNQPAVVQQAESRARPVD